MAELVAAGLVLLAGVVQGVTGFGASIVMMLGLPYFFAVPQAAGISTAVCMALNAALVWRYRRRVNVRKALLPAILFMAVSAACISLSASLDAALMKRILGGFLLLLALYYLFFDRSDKRRTLPLWASLLCIVISGACDGLFGIGGPLMVLYYLNQTEDRDTYMGTMALCFLACCVFNTAYRLLTGVLQPEHLPAMGAGGAAVLVGAWIAGKIVNRLRPDLIRRLIYGTIGLSGILNLILS